MTWWKIYQVYITAHVPYFAFSYILLTVRVITIASRLPIFILL